MRSGDVVLKLSGVPRDLLRAFDEAIRGEYRTRSEALRDLIRHYVEEKMERR